jgi:hypothetical protein
MADHANIAAAQAAGYTVTRHDRGASSTLPRYTTVIEKWLVGEAGQNGFPLRATGESNVSANAADSAALASLNSQRSYRYAGKGSHGGSLTIDVH